MERKTLGFVLATIPIITVIAALVIAYAVTGDASRMVLETGPDEVIYGYLEGFTGTDTEMISVSGYSISDDKEKLLLGVAIQNPINYPLMVSSMSYTTDFNGKPIVINLDKQLEVMPGSKAEIILTGDLSEHNLLTRTPQMPDNPDPSGIKTEISFAGIILRNNGGVQ